MRRFVKLVTLVLMSKSSMYWTRRYWLWVEELRRQVLYRNNKNISWRSWKAVVAIETVTTLETLK